MADTSLLIEPSTDTSDNQRISPGSLGATPVQNGSVSGFRTPVSSYLPAADFSFLQRPRKLHKTQTSLSRKIFSISEENRFLDRINETGLDTTLPSSGSSSYSDKRRPVSGSFGERVEQRDERVERRDTPSARTRHPLRFISTPEHADSAIETFLKGPGLPEIDSSFASNHSRRTDSSDATSSHQTSSSSLRHSPLRHSSLRHSSEEATECSSVAVGVLQMEDGTDSVETRVCRPASLHYNVSLEEQN